MTLLSSGALALPKAAHAYVAGNVSYSRFIEAVNNHDIAKFTIAADGKTGNYFSVEGTKGSVTLLNDPGLFKLLESNGVDLDIETVN